MLTGLHDNLHAFLLGEPSPATLIQWIRDRLKNGITTITDDAAEAINSLRTLRTTGSRTVYHVDLECALNTGRVVDSYQLTKSAWTATVTGVDKVGLPLSVIVTVTDAPDDGLEITGFILR